MLMEKERKTHFSSILKIHLSDKIKYNLVIIKLRFKKKKKTVGVVCSHKYRNCFVVIIPITNV